MILNGILDFTFYHLFPFHFTLSFCISCHCDDDEEAWAARQSQVHRNLLRLWRTDRRYFCATVHRLISGSLLRAAEVSDMWRQFGISEVLIAEFQQPFIDKKIRQLWQTWHFFSCWGVITGFSSIILLTWMVTVMIFFFLFLFLLNDAVRWAVTNVGKLSTNVIFLSFWTGCIGIWKFFLLECPEPWGWQRIWCCSSKTTPHYSIPKSTLQS